MTTTILAIVAVLGVVFLVSLWMLLHARWETVEVDAGGDVRTGAWVKIKLRRPTGASRDVPRLPCAEAGGWAEAAVGGGRDEVPIPGGVERRSSAATR